jgi:hypothetical protein
MGGGGSGPPGYNSTYDAYEHSPTAYQGQNEVNQASAGTNDRARDLIEGRIIPNMGGIDYYRLINRLHLEATERVNDRTDLYVQEYPAHMVQKIITMEEAYQRINDYVAFFATFDKDAFKTNVVNHKKWFNDTKTAICDMKNRAAYYRDRITIQNAIEAAIRQSRTSYLTEANGTGAGVPFSATIPAELNADDFLASYVSVVGEDTDPNRFRIYTSIPANQTGDV